MKTEILKEQKHETCEVTIIENTAKPNVFKKINFPRILIDKAGSLLRHHTQGKAA